VLGSLENHSQEQEDSMAVYLKYGDVKGDVTDSAHAGWIELTSASWGWNRPPTITEVAVYKASDSASPRLVNEAASGSAVAAFIDFVRDDGTVNLRLTMSDTVISSYSVSGSGGSPSESLTLNASKIDFQNTPGTPPP
jgi:type VI secretion system secreted protein Hcp